MKIKIAIVGATGVVGRTVLKILEQKQMTNYDFVFYASKKSAGKNIVFNHKAHKVFELNKSILSQNFNYALFCTKEEVSKIYVKNLALNGTTVIDFSSAYRKEYPLIVPEINFDKAKGKILCNPNCSTIASVMALYKIKEKYGIKNIVFSTYQAVSGAGKLALDDFYVRNKQNLKSLPFPIQNNLFSFIGEIKNNKFSKEENKMIYETKKILNIKFCKISATCVRVPIKVGHSISINFETNLNTNLIGIKNCIKNSENVKIVDTNELMPMCVCGQDDVFVGRIRKTELNKNSFAMFVVSDNLRKGAAQNGVQILQKVIQKDGF